MRIRTAIFVVYVGASALGLVAVTGLVLRDVRLRYVESMRRTLGDTAAYMAAFAAPATDGEDWTAKLATLPKQTDLLRVFACDREGKVIFDSADKDLNQVYQWPMRGGGYNASEGYTVSNVAVVEGELRVVARVLAAGEHLGWVGVGRPLAAVEEGVRAARWRLVALIGAIAGVMVVLGWWIAARLTRSLEKLTDYAHRVRDGRPAAPPVSRAREIAELGRAFEEMREALEGRQHVERYTQTLAHEVKAPLSAIRGAAELLDETMPVEQRQKFLANIRTESARIQRIIDRLLELSSLEARKQLRQVEMLPVEGLMRAAADTVRSAGEPRGIRVSVHGGEGAQVRGEAVLLREALVNLLQNALDFSPSGGAVTLAARGEAGRVLFTVEDQGPGVPDFAQARVFERFYSLPRPGTERKSTGLGLALVREIAHLHGGEAGLENRPEGGARASLELPAA
ncbi:Sensor protein CreC [Lacunisphaera limnophila]|uniref:histidine kinase n=1 Tax=Lacunisphaera limnophila TaxID=1838286 RepID=A0A1D8ARJ9_9BACT|nr:two-component system sensor histidine kinase CreC [Lacunisphaera limnophila]AOS43489.1 Sensor protein CreC [Lacunisphaera limnophila]